MMTENSPQAAVRDPAGQLMVVPTVIDQFPVVSSHPCRRFQTPAMRIFLAASIFLVFLCANTICPGQVRQAWVVHYNNGIVNGTNQAVKMALDGAGNIYVTGFSQDTNGNLDYATIEYAPNGSQVWAARHVPTNAATSQPTGLALDSSTNVVVTGSACTVKYDNGGHELWNAPYLGNSVAVDGSNNVFVSGFATNLGVVKLSPAGSNLWEMAQSVAYVPPNIGQTLCVDSNGNSFVAGYTTFYFGSAGPYYYGTVTKYDPNGSVLWTNQFQYGAYAEPLIQSTALDQSGNDYVLLNNGSGPYATPFSTFKFAGGTGQLLWQVGDPANALDSFGEGLALDGLGNVWVTGSEVFRYPSSQYGTYRLNTNGNYNLTNLFPAAAGMVSVATSIAIDAGNNVYVTGFSPCTNTGNDIVTIKYDHNGNMIWLERYNGAGSGDDEGKAIGVDAIGNVYVTGYDTTPAGGTEMVTIKYVPAATIQREGNGDILLQNQGEPGEMFDFQASTNLQNWLNLGTMSADTNGFVQFLDTNAPNLAHRFYLTLPQ